MRKKRLAYNAMASLIYQIVSIICGLVLPRAILATYGSNINGLVNSISQFLGFIAFFELGVGAVIQSALYKPLALGDNLQISRIVASGNKFFRGLAKILLVYVFILLFIYPLIINKDFDFIYTDILIVAISISLFAQYYFGQVNRLLITADQHEYIFSLIASGALIINTIASVILINTGASIQFVKITTSIIYLARPALLYYYVKKHYNIDRKIKYTEEPIKQKKNGIAQHIAAYALGGLDVIILTTLSTLSNVSIYSVYYFVVSGVKTLVTVVTSGMQSLLGELIAKKEEKKLVDIFSWYEWSIHSIVVIIFGCCSVLIVSFVKVYTLGIKDANYDVPLFGFLITIANMLQCFRLPYSSMILASNKYKETQNNYIIAAAINIVISVICVYIWGLIGVAIGSLIALAYHTIWMTSYNSKVLIKWPLIKTIKQFATDAIIIFISYILSQPLVKTVDNYFDWVIIAIQVFFVWVLIWFIVNFVLYRNRIKQFANKFIYHRKNI